MWVRARIHYGRTRTSAAAVLRRKTSGEYFERFLSGNAMKSYSKAQIQPRFRALCKHSYNAPVSEEQSVKQTV